MDAKVVELFRRQHQVRHAFKGIGWLLLFVGVSFALAYLGLRALLRLCMELLH